MLEYLLFSVYKIMLPANRDNFTSIFPFGHFLFLIGSGMKEEGSKQTNDSVI